MKLNSIKKMTFTYGHTSSNIEGKENTLNLKAVLELAFVLALRHVHRAVVSENIQQSVFLSSTSSDAVKAQSYS